MLSRVADSLYWIGRYVERAGNVARYADVNRYLTLDLPQAGTDWWSPLVHIMGDSGLFYDRHRAADAASVLRFLAYDADAPNSILACLARARDNARAIRDAVSLEMWTQLNRVHARVRAAADAPGQPLPDPAFFEDVKLAALQFSGILADTMTHNEGWHFWRLGQQVERADKTARLLDVKYFLLLPDVHDVGTPFDELQWAALLKSASAYEMYRQRHGRFAPERIVEFLLLDRAFPRAVHACLVAADESLHAISGRPVGTFCNPAEQRVGQLRSQLAFARAPDIILGGFHEFLESLQAELNGLDRDIFETYFALRSAAAVPAHPELQASPQQ